MSAPFLPILRLLAASRSRQRDQWLNQEQLAALRVTRLQRLVGVAARAPHYAELAGLRVTDLSVLQHLPILEKSTLQDEGADQLLTQPLAGLSPVATSGSTGLPLRLFRSSSDQAQVSAAWRRIFRAYGQPPMGSQVNIGSGRTVAKRGPVALLRRLRVLPSLPQLASFAPLPEQIAVLRAAQPRMISAYGVALETLADAVLERGVIDIRPRVIYSSGTALTPRCRAVTRQAFGVEPFDVYAANEVGPIAWECPVVRDVRHVSDDTHILEIVDERDRPVPVGEVGQVLVTHLVARAQPLIRYRLGDLAALLPGRCACGRGLGLMTPVQGRTLHTIRSPGGQTINTITVSSILASSPDVRRYQVRQTSPVDLRVLVVAGLMWSEGSADRVRELFAERLGDAFRYEVERVDELPLTPGGKFQTIIPWS